MVQSTNPEASIPEQTFPVSAKSMHILQLAAENGALPGAKEGGVADVIQHIAPALARQGCRVTTLIPSHGFLHRLEGAREMASVDFWFRGVLHRAVIYELTNQAQGPLVRHCVVHHPLLEAYDPDLGRHRIYVHDEIGKPFQTDSSRFACFSAAAAAAVARGIFGAVDVLHLHDWHAALVALLRKSDPDYLSLAPIRTVFSIHNLGLQGLRPLSGNSASLEAWFPGLRYDWLDVADPRHADCVNPMAVGIRLCDRVHTVSPRYAEEIRHPSRKPHFFGAEGLEKVIAYAHDTDRLRGILNGCDYSRDPGPADAPAPWPQIIQQEILHWTAGRPALPSTHFVAYQRLEQLKQVNRPPKIILTTVGRAVDQKLRLLREPSTNGLTALEQILGQLGERGIWIMLASGAADYENYLSQMAARHDNFIFLNGYSDACADILYREADLFVMPSSYEPCGISQMLAMRNGIPCLVHGVGGLRDTVIHHENGFVFQGWTITEQVDRFVSAAAEAIHLQRENGAQWQAIKHRAATSRFEWDATARQYCNALYGRGP